MTLLQCLVESSDGGLGTGQTPRFTVSRLLRGRMRTPNGYFLAYSIITKQANFANQASRRGHVIINATP